MMNNAGRRKICFNDFKLVHRSVRRVTIAAKPQQKTKDEDEDENSRETTTETVEMKMN